MSEDTDIPEHEEANKVFSSILEELKNKDNKKYSIREYWAHIHEKNHSTNLHHHAVVPDLKNAPIFSGVYYIAADDKVDKIIFHKPVGGPQRIKLNATKYNPFNSQTWWYTVKTGDLVLFPSHLTHGVDMKKEKDTRISLSFNVFFKGTIGDKRQLTELIL